MKIIFLTNGKECLIDDEDFDSLSEFKWYEAPGEYARLNVIFNPITVEIEK